MASMKVAAAATAAMPARITSTTAAAAAGPTMPAAAAATATMSAAGGAGTKRSRGATAVAAGGARGAAAAAAGGDVGVVPAHTRWAARLQEVVKAIVGGRVQVVEGGHLKLPDGITWPHRYADSPLLFVRKQYEPMYEHVLSRLESPDTRVIVTGQPGIGKSMFGYVTWPARRPRS